MNLIENKLKNEKLYLIELYYSLDSLRWEDLLLLLCQKQDFNINIIWLFLTTVQTTQATINCYVGTGASMAGSYMVSTACSTGTCMVTIYNWIT